MRHEGKPESRDVDSGTTILPQVLRSPGAFDKDA
jgi:hypothetical protein